MVRPIKLKVIRGTTLVSGEYFSVNETVPPDISYAELLAGIGNDTYTLKSLGFKSYKGQVRDRANSALKAELQFSVANDRMKFSILNTVTETWENKAATFFYDVFETDLQTEIVKLAAHGTIEVIPAMTLPESE